MARSQKPSASSQIQDEGFESKGTAKLKGFDIHASKVMPVRLVNGPSSAVGRTVPPSHQKEAWHLVLAPRPGGPHVPAICDPEAGTGPQVPAICDP